MIEFKEVSSGNVVGRVRLQDGELKAEPALKSLVDAWTINMQRSPEEFMEHYGTWSNGYLESATAKDEEPVGLKSMTIIRIPKRK